MADNQMQLRAIVVSARAALSKHPEDARNIVRRAGYLLDELETDVIQDGTEQTLLIDIAAARSQLRIAAGMRGATDPRNSE